MQLMQSRTTTARFGGCYLMQVKVSGGGEGSEASGSALCPVGGDGLLHLATRAAMPNLLTFLFKVGIIRWPCASSCYYYYYYYYYYYCHHLGHQLTYVDSSMVVVLSIITG